MLYVQTNPDFFYIMLMASAEFIGLLKKSCQSNIRWVNPRLVAAQLYCVEHLHGYP